MIDAFLLRDLVLAAALVASVVDDLRRKRISNFITLPAFALGLLLAFLSGGLGDYSHGLGGALMGALAAGGLFVLLWLTSGGIGGGDAKLMCAVGALVGFPAAVGTLLFVTVAGGLQGVFALFVSRPPVRALLLRLGVKSAADPRFGRAVRYGIAIALGTLAFRLWLHFPPA